MARYNSDQNTGLPYRFSLATVTDDNIPIDSVLFDEDVAYTVGTKVTYNNHVYIALVDTLVGPFLAFQWEDLGERQGFQLLGGEVKVQDSISMVLAFLGFFRVYVEEFVPDVLWLLQKPTSLIQSFKTLILGRFLQSLRQYAPFLEVEKINIQYDYENRKEFGIAIQWVYALQPDKSFQTVQFIQP